MPFFIHEAHFEGLPVGFARLADVGLEERGNCIADERV